MVLNSVKNIVIGTYTAISAFLGTKKIFPNTSSYVSTYYSQSITPANAILSTIYTATRTISLIEAKTTNTSGTGTYTKYCATYNRYTTLAKQNFSGNLTTNSTISSYTRTVSLTNYSASSISESTYESYSRKGYTYYTTSYATKQITAQSFSSSKTIQTGYITEGNYKFFQTATGTKQSYYTAQAAATYSRTSNQSSVNSRTTTTNGTFVKVSNKSYLTTLTSNV